VTPPYRANFDVPVVAAAMDREAVIRNIVSRIEQAEFGASVGYLAGLPVSEAIAHELRSLLVDVELQQGFETADWYASGHGIQMTEDELDAEELHPNAEWNDHS
jgi:hypothetical protein